MDNLSHMITHWVAEPPSRRAVAASPPEQFLSTEAQLQRNNTLRLGYVDVITSGYRILLAAITMVFIILFSFEMMLGSSRLSF